jgi:hypothetical protein
LTVQNQYYGEREELPFDLQHKAGPIEFWLAPDATTPKIVKERAKLRDILVVTLKPYLTRTPAASSAAWRAMVKGQLKRFYAEIASLIEHYKEGDDLEAYIKEVDLWLNSTADWIESNMSNGARERFLDLSGMGPIYTDAANAKKRRMFANLNKYKENLRTMVENGAWNG